MSLTTDIMRQTAERQIHAGQRESGKWSAIEFVNHPTPSGCDRWLPTYEDNREWEDAETAKRELRKLLESQEGPRHD